MPKLQLLGTVQEQGLLTAIQLTNLRAPQWGHLYCYTNVLLTACSWEPGSIAAPLGPCGWGSLCPSTRKKPN